MIERPLLFDRYRLVRRLGRGAYATVYLAHDTRMGRPVAVKVIEDSVDVDGRALREAQAAAKLDHPHIVTVHEVHREPSRTLLITEYVDGRTLRDAYSHGGMSDAEVVQVGIQACKALEQAHRRKVIHRDIKPENIMLCSGDEVDVRIMDFGVARLEDVGSVTQEGDLIGTLVYMAPEQAEGREAGPKADVFSLALVLYEGLTGVNPLRGKPVSGLVGGGLHRSLPPLRETRPDVPAELAEAIEAALAPREDVRVDAAAFRRLLQRGARVLPEPDIHTGLVEKTLVAFRGEDTRRRWSFTGRRLVAGGLALATLSYVLPRIPFYPPSAVIYVVTVCSFLALLWPAGGGAAALLSLVPPIFSVAAGWGILYVAVVVPVYALLVWRGYSWAALLPFIAPLLCALAGRSGTPTTVLLSGVALCLPFVAGMFARFWGPVLGFFSGLAIALAAGFQGWALLPFSFSPGSDPALETTRYLSSVGEVATALARFLDGRTELGVQILVMTVFALPLQGVLRGSTVQRLWVGAVYVAALGAAVLLLPPLVSRADSRPWLSAVALVPCVIIVLLSSALFPTRGLER